MQSFPIFVINLPTATLRRAAIENQLNNLGAKYEVVEGVFGNDFRVTERYDGTLSLKERGREITIGERGCALAHTLVYERMIKDEIKVALILEDDIILPTDIITIIESEIAKKNRRWDWLSFDYRYVGTKFLYHWFLATIRTIRKKPLFFFYALAKSFYIPPLTIFEGVRDKLARKYIALSGAKGFYRPLYNAGAYLVTIEGVNKLLPLTKPLRFAADELPNIARLKVDFKLFGYVPLIVKQNTDEFKTAAGLSNEEWEVIFASMEKG